MFARNKNKNSPCPICSDTAAKRPFCKATLATTAAFDVVECSRCRVRYFEPMPSLQELQDFYSGEYYDFQRHKEEGKGMAFAAGLKRWRKHGRFLDVGCATGYFLNGVKQHSGWEVYGTDFGEDAVRNARDELGLDVRHGELTDAGFDAEFFDYVHVNNVLEHVREPLALLRECRRIIKPDGKFFLSVPNGRNDSLDLYDFYNSESRPARSKSGHIFFFAADTLQRMFDEVGFVVEKEKTYSLKRGMRSFGWLKRKKNWKQVYEPRETTAVSQPPSSDTATGRRYPGIYYRYRFAAGNLKMLPGLHDFGLDFLFILRPR